MTEVTQIVTARGDFRKPDEVADVEHNSGVDLACMAVLGPRASGKSTLLNRLFGTDSAIANPLTGKGGTKGAWVATGRAGGRPLVALDTQGFEATAGDEAAVVAKVAMLSLALADCVVFNLWAADIGRFDAAGYSLLRTVFTEHMHVFLEERARKTLLLFIVRDHDDGSSPAIIKRLLTEDVKKLWDEAEKPMEYAGAAVEESFDLDVVTLPHIKFKKEDFDAEVRKLQSRFVDPGSPHGYLFKPAYTKAVPGWALGTYAEVLWGDIAKQGPRGFGSSALSTKDLQASYLCDRAFNDERVRADRVLARWRADADSGRVTPNLGQQAEALLAQARASFDSRTSAFPKAIERDTKRRELMSWIEETVRGVFEKEMTHLQNEALQRLREGLTRSLRQTSSPRIPDNERSKILTDAKSWFTQRSESLSVESLGLVNRAATREVNSVLDMFSAQFHESPAAQMHAIRQIRRQAQRKPRRVKTVIPGVTLTAAIRPGGFGNFQAIAGYSDGPHAVNVSVCNDADAAEQEGQGQVPFFRFQPSLNFDIDL
eukprot:CAMPEP_0184682282 /NCGR_PEP_ID=MMETSP0312-20130426/6638_1 /TAXON_ID=31354 /ORGANISM="Compsopogon coeruleus, Strain SAG 36.94" /LENGTH=542 /DNA_ID=CAMNT_0027133845 /DNA_START=84 /DNA_END=1712 /DNA_ORIENTATION=+